MGTSVPSRPSGWCRHRRFKCKDGRVSDFDVLILGAGSGGYSCALRAAQLGLKVGLVEKGNLGGTCLHIGCIPTKALLHAAEIADSTRESEQFGVKASLEGIDMAGVNAYKDGVVQRLFKGLTGLIKGRGITVIEGEGRLTGPREVTVAGTAYSGDHVVLASGSYAKTLPGLDLDGRRIITSDEALRLDRVPASVIVLGGGVIGCEFASVWRSFGAEVTIIEALPRLVAAGGRGVVEGARAGLPQARHRLPDRHAVPERQDHRRRRGRHRRRWRRPRGRAAAGRGRSRPGHRRAGLRRAGRHDGPRLRGRRRAVPHQPRQRLGGRRHRAGAAAGPPRLPAGDLRGRGDRRPRARGRSTSPASRGSPTPTRRSPRSG